VESERIELLQHPLIAELLNHKWNKMVLPSFLTHFGLYVLFLGFLTSYILTLPNPRGSICRKTSKKIANSTKSIYVLSLLDLTESCPGKFMFMCYFCLKYSLQLFGLQSRSSYLHCNMHYYYYHCYYMHSNKLELYSDYKINVQLGGQMINRFLYCHH